MIAEAVSVIIPIYGNGELTQRCVASVLRNSDPRHQIILINDASPDLELGTYCREVADDTRVFLIEHSENRGFVSSANQGIKMSQDRDVVILNSDTTVPHGWLDRLLGAANKNPRAASITPFSNNATICSYPTFCADNPLPKGLDAADIDRKFSQANAGKTLEIPTGVGFCMYMRRAAIDEVGLLDEEAFGRGYGEENDWCCRAILRGWQHLLCADLFVYHAGGASFGADALALQANALKVISSRYPGYEKDIAAFVERDPAEPYRFAVDLLRLDREAILEEYRARAANERESRYALDRQRHQQVTELGEVLQLTRQSAQEEVKAYEEILSSLRGEVAERETQYQAQISEMATGQQQLAAELSRLNAELSRLNASRVIRLWSAILRRWGR